MDGMGWMGWDGWYPGGRGYRAPYGANNNEQLTFERCYRISKILLKFVVLFSCVHKLKAGAVQFKVGTWPYPSGCISTVWGFSQAGPTSRSRSFSGPSSDLHACMHYRGHTNSHCSGKICYWRSQMWKRKLIWTSFDILTHKGWRSEEQMRCRAVFWQK